MSTALEDPLPGSGLLGFHDAKTNGNGPVSLLAAICTLSLVLGGTALAWPAFLKWLPILLLTLPVGACLLAAAWARLRRQRCVSCGHVPTGASHDLSPCPLCDELFSDRKGVSVENGTLPLARYLSHPASPLRVIGLILTLAIRDKACEVRFVRGRTLLPSDLWLAQGNLWQVWVSTDDGSFEVIPPPQELAPSIFAILRHLVRHTQEEPNAVAHFQIPLGEHTIDAQLSVEQSDEQQVARVQLQQDVPEATRVAGEWLKQAFRSQESDPCVSRGTAWTIPAQVADSLWLHDLRSSADPHMRRLAEALDFALDCRKEEFEFVEDAGRVLAHWSKEGVRTQVPMNGCFDGLPCLELLAEIQKRAQQDSNGNEARFQIVGSLHQAMAILKLEEADDKRRAAFCFDYNTTRSP